GALSFAAFSAFWATLALDLHALPGHYGPRTAGAYGALGLIGALAAPLVGKSAEGRGDRRINASALGKRPVGFAGLGAFGNARPGYPRRADEFRELFDRALGVRHDVPRRAEARGQPC